MNSPLLPPGVEQIKYPSVIRLPRAPRDLTEMRQGAEIGARIVSDQHFEVHAMVEDGDRVAVQFTWTAPVMADLGAVPAGTRLVPRGCLSIFCDGLVLEQSSRDCYEPIAS